MFAAEDDQEEPSTLEMETKFPVLSGESGDIFEFDVNLTYEGSERRGFDLITTVPPGWVAVITAGYPEKQIPYIELEPNRQESVKVKFRPVIRELPEPGEYVVTLEVSSGDVIESMELKVEITARYEFAVFSGLPQGNLNPKATAGEDYHLPILVANSGSAAIEDITFSSTKPEGWHVTFNP